MSSGSTASSSGTWTECNDGIWTTWKASNTSASIKATFCFLNPSPFNYKVNMWGSDDIERPSLGWDNFTGVYKTEQIQKLYGGAAPNLTFQDRGVLRLEESRNWTAVEAY